MVRKSPRRAKATPSKAPEPLALFRALLAHRRRFRWNTQPPLTPEQLAEMDALIARVTEANKANWAHTHTDDHHPFFFFCIKDRLDALQDMESGTISCGAFMGRMLPNRPGIRNSKKILQYLRAYPHGTPADYPKDEKIKNVDEGNSFCGHNYDRYGELFLWSMWEAYRAAITKPLIQEEIKKARKVDNVIPNEHFSYRQDTTWVSNRKAVALQQARKTDAEQIAELREFVESLVDIASSRLLPPSLAQVIRLLKLREKYASVAREKKRGEGRLRNKPSPPRPRRDRGRYIQPNRVNKAGMYFAIDTKDREALKATCEAMDVTVNELFTHWVRTTNERGADPAVKEAIEKERQRSEQARANILDVMIPSTKPRKLTPA